MQKKYLNNKRLRYIFLMVTSQVVLTLFVGYWLSTQYDNEKQVFQKDLIQIWRSTVNDYNNKQMFINQIGPILLNPDTLHPEKIDLSHLGFHPDKKRALVRDMVQLINEYPEEVKHYTNYITQEYPYPKTDENIDLIINNTLKLHHRYGIRTNYYSYLNSNSDKIKKADLKLFQSMFTMRVKIKDSNINIEYLPKNKVLMPKESTIYLERYNKELKHREIAILFTNYYIYLLSVIAPQLLFALILLCLTGFALFFTYRGYVKQMKLNTLRSDFINNITHELKIPVATAKVALEALKKFGLQGDAATTEEYLNMVSREMERLDQLTERVLTHSVFESGSQEIKLEETDMNTFITEANQSLQILYAGQNATITCTTPPAPIKNYVDKVYLEGIIKNLVDNSLKYGGKGVSINIQLLEDKDGTFITVSDDGPGIKKEYTEKIFEKFFRVPTGNKHNIKGHGLGLSFAALLMKQHKGSITVNNLKEGGCRFILKFPKLVN
ncbi:sensor histidine kinase [Carboxylicivirga marina]|uniref:histidine kinase n=1 Tax=Carboxylicivirga marina TaxID=2800988 RepID=A0ABS1HM79_9BACT|nr:HAMP domain-containing sensor histidine kinase [Carboxylicivirga marina]MBK3518789.1 HAMP domain-containing histidine kinase [Carboxylicivirga marina]